MAFSVRSLRAWFRVAVVVESDDFLCELGVFLLLNLEVVKRGLCDFE